VTVTAFSHAVAEALAIAIDWLERDRADRVLLVAGDEVHPVGAYALTHLGRADANSPLQALDLEHCSYVPGESYAAMLLGRADATPARHGVVDGPHRFHGRLPSGEGPIFLGARGDAAEGPAYLEAVGGAGPVGAYAGLWGASPTSDAHSLLAAALALADGGIPGASASGPVSPGLTVLASGPTGARAIRCVSVDAGGRGTEVCILRG